MTTPGQRYHLVLEPLRDDVPDVVRLRRALKCLLRSFRLRCTSARVVDGNGEQQPLPEDGQEQAEEATPP